ncbi:MAG: homoserine kinase [Actinomycetota bacterium]
MLARVPASTANLGPGFDVLAIALALYLEVEITPASSFSMSSTGEGSGMYDGPDHIAAVTAREVLGHDGFHLRVHSEIPLARGLGSSAAIVLAAAAAAGASSPAEYACRFDGHAENAVASWLGGLVATWEDGKELTIVRPGLDASWKFVVAIPDVNLDTERARSVLPAQVPYADAINNLGRLLPLVQGLGDHREMKPTLMHDNLHQPYRSALLPFAQPVLDAMVGAGAQGACWSGAGSSLLGITLDDHAAAVVASAEATLREHQIPGRVLVLEADRDGLSVRP